MFNEFKLLNTLKTDLDADATLSTLLNKLPDSTKVALGPSRPRMAQNPSIHLFVSSHTVDEEAKWDLMEISCAVFASDNTDGTADIQQIANIADRVAAMLDEGVLTIDAQHRQFNIQLTGIGLVVPEPDTQDGYQAHQQTLRFSFRGIQK